MGEKTRLTTHESTGPVDSSVSRFEETGFDEEDRDREIYARAVSRLRLLWEQRKFLIRVTSAAFVLSLLITLLIPNQYQSTTRLMPPDQNNSDMSKLALLAGQAGAGLGALAGDALGLKSSGALFVGILQSRTVQDDVIGQFDLRKAYGDRR